MTCKPVSTSCILWHNDIDPSIEHCVLAAIARRRPSGSRDMSTSEQPARSPNVMSQRRRSPVASVDGRWSSVNRPMPGRARHTKGIDFCKVLSAESLIAIKVQHSTAKQHNESGSDDRRHGIPRDRGQRDRQLLRCAYANQQRRTRGQRPELRRID